MDWWADWRRDRIRWASSAGSNGMFSSLLCKGWVAAYPTSVVGRCFRLATDGYQYWNKDPTLQRRLSPAGVSDLGSNGPRDRSQRSPGEDHRLRGRRRGVQNRPKRADTNDDHGLGGD